VRAERVAPDRCRDIRGGILSQPVERFAHRLAIELGREDVEGMLRSLTSRQLTLWKAFANVDGLPTERLSLALAMIGADLANKMRQSNSDRVRRPDDFLPFHLPDQQTDEDIASFFENRLSHGANQQT